MKKILSLVMALTLVMCMSVTAFATDTIITDPSSSPDNQATGDVTVTANEKTTGVIYSVTVSIPDLTFTYSFGDSGTWSPATLTYSESTEAGWVGSTSAIISVTNRSNADVNVGVLYTPEDDHTDISGTFDQDSDVLTTADNGGGEAGAGAATKTEFELTISGNPASAFTATKVGTVTVTVTAAEV